MGLSRIGTISKQLIAGGLSKTTPVAVIQKGTNDDQKILIGNLSNIAQKIKTNKITPPSIIIVGNVVKLNKIISWRK